ncbi:hypothetical protein Tco_0065839 [Tanacetum coccineum]
MERASVLHQPDGVRLQRNHIVPIRELNGVLIALVARLSRVPSTHKKRRSLKKSRRISDLKTCMLPGVFPMKGVLEDVLDSHQQDKLNSKSTWCLERHQWHEHRID